MVCPIWTCSRGGIGRRKGLKIPRTKGPCEFESHREYHMFMQIKKKPLLLTENLGCPLFFETWSYCCNGSKICSIATSRARASFWYREMVPSRLPVSILDR